MRGAVPLVVEAGVVQAEVGAQVDQVRSPIDQLGEDLLRRSVGQAGEHDVDVGQLVEIDGSEHEVGVGAAKRRMQIGHPPAHLRVPGGHLEREAGVDGQEPQHLGPGEPRRADQPDGEARRRW